MEKVFNNKDINHLLDCYYEEVKKSHYTKNVPYDFWRQLCRAKSVKITAFSCYFYVAINNNLTKMEQFTINDGGFGSFLTEHLNKEMVALAGPIGDKGPAGTPGPKSDFFTPTNMVGLTNQNTITDSINSITSPCFVDFDSNLCKYNTKTNYISIGEKSLYDNITVDLYDKINDNIQERLENLEKKMNDKEKDNMKGFNFDFGPCTNDNIRMSVYGLAIKNTADTWVSYDSDANQIIDVDVLNFDGRKFMFKMPVAIKDIAVGDIVIHNRVPMFVTDIDNGVIKAVDVRAGERKEIIPTKSPFGFNFISKIVTLFGSFNGSNMPSESNPFGNPMMFMLMGDNENGKSMEMKDIMLMSMFMNGKVDMDMSNPLMMMMLMDKMS